MLARRFTIVCLLMTIFGMGLAMVVAEASRTSPARTPGTLISCAQGLGIECPRR